MRMKWDKVWESALKNSRATHREGVIISQPIQKLRLIFKLNSWSSVAITMWFSCFFLSMWGMRFLPPVGGWDEGEAWVDASVRGSMASGMLWPWNRELTCYMCYTHLLPPEQNDRQPGAHTGMLPASSIDLGAICEKSWHYYVLQNKRSSPHSSSLLPPSVSQLRKLILVLIKISGVAG